MSRSPSTVYHVYERTDPRREDDCARGHWVVVVSQIHQQCEGQAAACAVSSNNDVLRGDVEIVHQSEVRADCIVKRPWKACLGSEAVVKSCS